MRKPAKKKTKKPTEEQKNAVSNPTSIMVATPMYGGLCSGEYVSGLLNTVVAMRAQNVSVFWSYTCNESLITRGRNELARLFLEKGCDYLMFIDADIAFDGNAVRMLLDADRDISCGIYPKKEIDWNQVGKHAQGMPAENFNSLAEYAGSFVFNMAHEQCESDEKGMIEVRHGGTGFMLIKRRVFEELMPHVPTYRTSTYKDPATGEFTKPLTHEFFATSIDHTGALLSEDYHFCDLWRKHGGKVYANPFIKLKHIGTYYYGGDILRTGGNLK